MKNIVNPISLLALSLLGIYCRTSLQGQDTILLMNPSFEDIPHRGSAGGLPIKMWDDCGFNAFPGESPPDIHPVPDGAWEVGMQPQDGSTYLGLVARANGTYESVGQRLFTPLRAGTCYSLTAMMAQTHTYKSATAETIKNGTHNLENFIQPVKVIVWGGIYTCEKLEVLAESSAVTNQEWKPFEMILTPHNNYTYITIEAFYSISQEKKFNGHVLIDNLSPIIEVECK
ncbi:MAG TPA: hypothetical protein VLA46_04110 [Saprospiraceae bacterium]|nr:hypothetical protein [Saprospiraceae bacterium]